MLCENGTDVLMTFLYANGARGEHDSILGFTRLDKLMWLLSKTEEFEKLVDFEFDNENYGPLSVELYDTLQALIYAGLVCVGHKLKPQNAIDAIDESLIESEVSDFKVPWKFYSVEEYRLSQKGLVVAKALFKSLTDEQKRRLWIVKTDIGNRPMQIILHYVYMKQREGERG